MKICYCIAEYNPFHLGHKKHLDYIKEVLGADKTVVLMSGNFTQRGEPAVLDKFTRAKHAVLAGADLVMELPTVFATANAEIFAKGAIKTLSALNVSGSLCFGVESGEKEDFISVAKSFLNESKEYKKALKSRLEEGVSFAKARYLAVKDVGGEIDEKLISSPNNVLGVEYTKAILSSGAELDICPMQRQGDHNDKKLYKGITSASSIREKIRNGEFKKIKNNLPRFVYEDVKPFPFAYEKTVLGKLYTTPNEVLALAPDCTEGLENRIKALSKDNLSLSGLIEKATTKRYTSSRIKRIILANFLNITSSFLESCIKEPLYAKVLAVKKDAKDLISLFSESSSIPVITRKTDLSSLKKTALACIEKDAMANDVYNLLADIKTNENQMLIL